mgnify:CR=1 FL=1
MPGNPDHSSHSTIELAGLRGSYFTPTGPASLEGSSGSNPRNAETSWEAKYATPLSSYW